MIKKLTLENFKNFKKAELELGPFTLLVGANATGKSNIREAFRFLHGIGRGYTIPDIIGEKYAEGGVRVWNGIRGGQNEVAYQQLPFFTIHASVDVMLPDSLGASDVSYNISVSLPNQTVRHESFHIPNKNDTLFETVQGGYTRFKLNQSIKSENQPILYNLVKNPDFFISAQTGISPKPIVPYLKPVVNLFTQMRFFDFYPEVMRAPSNPRQIVLGDRGENLSSVLSAIWQNSRRKAAFLSWLEALTTMNAVDFEFPPDQIGRVLLTLVEQSGQRISAYSLSDGTLRFLAMLAAFLGIKESNIPYFYFFEEIENGIHPSRLHLLLELIEQVTSDGNVQVVATTHSPELLGLVSEQTLEHAALTYRLEGEPDAHIQRIMDIPNAREIFEEEDLSRLYERGWLENSVHFMKNGKASA
ncbi:MAG: AAA family ATPase [Anaerolineales bacterium]|nr:AAA family ATPase [Anaerolineales bacterium]MCA9931887.1 AAA family ATPase [Anaerolineales bacterium]